MVKKRLDDDVNIELSDEDRENIGSVVSPRKMSVREALETDDPLFHVANNTGSNNETQHIFNLLYAAILEIK